MENIKMQIRNFLLRSLKEKNIQDTDDLFKMGLVHSLFSIQLIMFIEKTFNVELNDEDLDLQKICTIQDIAQLVTQKLNLAIST